ncbi:hypothetical protein QQF64_010526 [Cirrhinus molitorella]|uniref:Uncharacterized protein n=1 Tax=Cirrhinus molitorella TaxID=172907 RepID=A0ABR3M7Q2_9TELE
MSHHRTRICLWPTKGGFASKSGRLWAGLDVPIGLSAALCIRVGSQVLAVCFILGPSSVPLSMAQPDEKTSAVGAIEKTQTVMGLHTVAPADKVCYHHQRPQTSPGPPPETRADRPAANDRRRPACFEV